MRSIAEYLPEHPFFAGLDPEALELAAGCAVNVRFPPYRWTFDARATEGTSAIAFDGACLRGKCETDPTLGYALLQRVVQVMSARLHSARVRLLDLYGSDS